MSFPHHLEKCHVFFTTDEKIWRVFGHVGDVPDAVRTRFSPLHGAPFQHWLSIPALDELNIIGIGRVVSDDECMISHGKFMHAATGDPAPFVDLPCYIWVAILKNLDLQLCVMYLDGTRQDAYRRAGLPSRYHASAALVSSLASLPS